MVVNVVVCKFIVLEVTIIHNWHNRQFQSVKDPVKIINEGGRE